MRYRLDCAIYGCIIGHAICKCFLRTLQCSSMCSRLLPGQPGYQDYWDRLRQRYLIIFSRSDISKPWFIDLRDETVRGDLSIRQWEDLLRIIEQKYLHGLDGVICWSSDADIIDHSRVLGNVPVMVKNKIPAIIQFVQDYVHPKCCWPIKMPKIG